MESSTILNGYEKGKLIGEGGWGKVYLCTKNDQTYAMKIVKHPFFFIKIYLYLDGSAL